MSESLVNDAELEDVKDGEAADVADQDTDAKDAEAKAAEADAKEGDAKDADTTKDSEDGKDADQKKDEKKAEGAPDEYEDFKVPDGVEVDPDEVAGFKEIAKEFNLTQEQAQRLIDFEAERVGKLAETQAELWTKTREEWAEKAKADKEYGGKAFKENVGLAKKALDAYGSKELAELCDSFGIGDHPEFIRLLVNVGKAMSEDKLEAGRGASAGQRDAASILFPNQNQ